MSENSDDDSNGSWIKVQSSNDGKRNHSSFSEQNSPQISINKNKKLFFTANQFKVLSPIDHETTLSSSIMTNAFTKNPMGSLNVKPKIALPLPILLEA